MKYLELPSITHINSLLDGIDVGDSILHSRIEAYSCKSTVDDKKLARSLTNSLERNNSDGLSHSFEEVSTSPFGPLTDGSCRKTFIFLVTTLNAVYPDYDFSTVTLKDFRKEQFESTRYKLNTILGASLPSYVTIQDRLWRALDDEINLREADIYSYLPDPDSDPFGEEGNIWSYNHFFYNRKLKRVVYWSCQARSKIAEDDSAENEGLWSYADEICASMDT